MLLVVEVVRRLALAAPATLTLPVTCQPTTADRCRQLQWKNTDN